MWAERTGTEIVRGAEGGDPSAIVFDAVQRAAARGNDLVLADTAGRLHTKVNLVEELKKIRRVADRDPGNVTEVLLVLDATTGQNALVQARQFTEAVDVTGHRAHQARRHGQGRDRRSRSSASSACPSSWSASARDPTTWWTSTPTSSSTRCSATSTEGERTVGSMTDAAEAGPRSSRW